MGRICSAATAHLTTSEPRSDQMKKSGQAAAAVHRLRIDAAPSNNSMSLASPGRAAVAVSRMTASSKVEPASGDSTPSDDYDDYDESAAPSRSATTLTNLPLPDEVAKRYVTPIIKGQLSAEMLERARMVAEFTVTGLHALWGRFRGLHARRIKLDSMPELESDRALAELTITGADVLDQHEFINHPLRETIGRALEVDPAQQLDFFAYLEVMSVFNVLGPVNPKTKFMFQMFHSNFQSNTAMAEGELGDQIPRSLGREELVETLRKLTGGNLSDEDIETLADHVFKVTDLDGNGRISYEEFVKLVGKTDISSSVSLNVDRGF